MGKSQQIAYLNGDFIPIEKAKISPQDRGYLFGDGVYEVIPVYHKRLFTFEAHLKRLKNSLAATQIMNPLEDEAWRKLLQKLVDMHPWSDQYIYLQVTRGIQMQRDHLPDDTLTPTLYAYTNELKPISQAIQTHGIKAITLEDPRWSHCDIKAITLLPNILMKMTAQQQGADEAILIGPNGYVTEGTSNNVFIVRQGQLLTPPLSSALLPGITRELILELAQTHHIPCAEQNLTLQDLETADEIWLTSSTKFALPVTQLNNQVVGHGQPGQAWQKMQHLFEKAKQAHINEYN